MIPDIGFFDILDKVVYTTDRDVTLGAILKFILLLTFSVFVNRVLTLFLRRSLQTRISRDALEFVIKIIYYGLLAIILVLFLPLIGLNPSGILVAGGIAGIVIGFASQNIVGNLISGTFLMIERPIKIGDQVNINNISGYITDIHIISTVIRTYDGLYVRIPNQQVFTSEITNYVEHPVRRFEYRIRIRYHDDAEKAIQIIKELIEEQPFALKNPTPSVFVSNLGESSVDIDVKIWGPVKEWYGVKTALLWQIKQALEAQGIEMPYPQQVVHLADDLEPGEKKW